MRRSSDIPLYRRCLFHMNARFALYARTRMKQMLANYKFTNCFDSIVLAGKYIRYAQGDDVCMHRLKINSIRNFPIFFIQDRNKLHICLRSKKYQNPRCCCISIKGDTGKWLKNSFGERDRSRKRSCACTRKCCFLFLFRYFDLVQLVITTICFHELFLINAPFFYENA